MAGAKVPLSFRIFKGDQLVREERLTLSVIKLGKVPSAHLKLDDETVSRMHAIIEVNGPGDVSIIDLGSTKGTFVNGQKVNKAKLMSGDTILVGETRIELTIGAEEAADVAPQGADFPAASALQAPAMMAPPMAAPAAAFEAPRPASSTGSPFGAPAANPGYAAQAPAPAFAPAPAYAASAPLARAPQAMPAPYASAAPMFQGGMDSIDEVGGANAIEVAAMLGDSVVKVQHCMNGSGGKVSAVTKIGFVTSAICLAGSAYAFTSAISGASYNTAKYETWTGTLKKPAWSFRPEMLNLNFDWLMLFGVIIGLAGIVYSLVRMRRETDTTPRFRIGSDPQVEFPLDSAPSASFPLVEPRGNEYVFNFAPGMEGEMSLDGQSMSLSDAAAQGRARPSSSTAGALEMTIPAKARIRVRSGQTTFLVSSVAQPRRHVSPLFATFEAMIMVFFAGSALAHIGFLFLLNMAGNDGTASDTDSADSEDISMRSASTSADDPPPPKEEEKPDDGAEESGGTGTAMALDEGKMGKKDSTRAEGQYKMARTSDQEQLARTQAVESARTAGILGSSALLAGGAFSSLTGTGDVSSGFDDANVFGGLLGNEAGEMNGGFGFGRSGFGPGGGGTGWGTIGTGRYGTIGHGSGTGSGYGVGGGRGGGRGHTASVPSVSIGQPDSQGDLDKAIIRRYIKRNEAKFSYCYEKQLLVDKNLAGTVMTQFLISPNGTVATASGKGVSGDVANCVASVIKAIAFPAPKGGGSVQVNYPFIFRQTAQ
ncbi:MAG: AgmX/PglI C-terminal domain-containing protein [Kofleriaceae bacterium]|nr:AgmX/PglI C-terminal domain-containing protein [Kofleriaceae bacterium]